MNGLSHIIATLIGSIGVTMTSPLGGIPAPTSDLSEVFDRARPAYTASVSDASGQRVGDIRRTGPLSSDPALFPPRFLQAVIAIEDHRFGSHNGIDPVALGSALASQVHGRPRGGSGIAQQMAKNAWLTPEQSWSRKLVEGMAALRAWSMFGPEGVMRAYLETAWFGRGVTGAAGAAQAWFGQDWDELDLGQMAYLAGILRGPAFYDALNHPERADERRDQVLRAMVREDLVTQEEADLYLGTPVIVAPRTQAGVDMSTRWMMSAARGEIEGLLSAHADEGRLASEAQITVTLEPEWQSMAQAALTAALTPIAGTVPLGRLGEEQVAEIFQNPGDADHLRRLARHHLTEALPWDSDARATLLLARDGSSWQILDMTGVIRSVAPDFQRGLTPAAGMILAATGPDEALVLRGRSQVEGAVVILDPRTGAILASIGGSDPSIGGFDRTRALRQPGSAAKSFLWLAALQNGYTPDTPVPDYEQTYVNEEGVAWTPRNYNRTESGMVSLRSAFEQSSNLVAAALIDTLGVEAMARTAEGAGAYPQGMRRHASAALGSSEVTLRDLVAGHATLVNDAVARAPRSVEELWINDELILSGGMLTGVSVRGAGPVASRHAAEDMLGMLRGVVTRGTAAGAFGGHPVTLVGKTGTSQGYRDAWFIGMTPHVAIGVWIGRDDNQPMPDGSGGARLAAPVAATILRQAHAAGLIDDLGYRDELRNSGTSWPPQPGTDRIQVPASEYRPASQPNSPSTSQSTGSSGVFSLSRDDPWVVPDRNGDLLRNRR